MSSGCSTPRCSPPVSCHRDDANGPWARSKWAVGNRCSSFVRFTWNANGTYFLRSAVGDDSLIADGADSDGAFVALDPRAEALVRISAIVALGAPAALCRSAIDKAFGAGASDEDIVANVDCRHDDHWGRSGRLRSSRSRVRPRIRHRRSPGELRAVDRHPNRMTTSRPRGPRNPPLRRTTAALHRRIIPWQACARGEWHVGIGGSEEPAAGSHRSPAGNAIRAARRAAPPARTSYGRAPGTRRGFATTG